MFKKSESKNNSPLPFQLQSLGENHFVFSWSFLSSRLILLQGLQVGKSKVSQGVLAREGLHCHWNWCNFPWHGHQAQHPGEGCRKTGTCKQNKSTKCNWSSIGNTCHCWTIHSKGRYNLNLFVCMEKLACRCLRSWSRKASKLPTSWRNHRPPGKDYIILY